MRYTGYRLASMLILTAAVLTGCGTLDEIVGVDEWKEWSPVSTSLQVQGDGSVIETIVDRLDQSWYTGDELQDMIARSMNEYNESHEEDSINVTEYSDAGGDVSVTIVYKTQEDYAAFNNVPFFCGAMLDAELEGYLFEGTFSEVEGASLKRTGLDPSEPLSHKDYDVCISDGTHTVQVPGEIRFVSSGAQIVNTHVAQLAGQTAPQETEAETEAEEQSEGMEDGDQETGSTWLYIIYERDQDAGTLSLAEPESGQKE